MQRMLDEGIPYRGRSPRHLVVLFREDEGGWWRAVVKATAAELCLVSYHRVNDRDAIRAARQLPSLL